MDDSTYVCISGPTSREESLSGNQLWMQTDPGFWNSGSQGENHENYVLRNIKQDTLCP